jgi:predicted RNase H-like HicB family nuclease
MAKTFHFPIVYQNDNDGYSVTVIGLDGVFTAGQTLDAARKNAHEAIALHLRSLTLEQLAELAPYELESKDVQLEVVEVKYG